MCGVSRDKIKEEGFKFLPFFRRRGVEPCLEGELGNDEVVYNGSTSFGSRVEGSPFDELFMYSLSNATPSSFCGL